jgi:putative oxidoreductase
MIDAALLLLRVTVGSLLAGHGSQKLFGSFGGPGLHGTRGMMESLGYKPSHLWAAAAGAGEFGGGMLTALGLLSPLGSLSAISVMATATAKAHWGKPVWVTSGGAELPLTNIAAAGAIALAGPGRYSVDRMFGIRLPRWFTLLSLVIVAGITANGIMASNRTQQERQAQSQPRPEPGEAEVSGEARITEPVSEEAMPEATGGS